MTEVPPKAALSGAAASADTAQKARLEAESCPECETGVVVQIGQQCGETGHVPYACSVYCGWSS